MSLRRRSIVPTWVLLSVALLACSSKAMPDGTTPGNPAGSSGGGTAATGGGGTAGPGGTGGAGGSLGMGVAPSGGPRPCGCAADQICVAWENIGSPSGLSLDCWKAPPACLTDSYKQGVESMCMCFNPCWAWQFPGEGGLACYDRRTNPNALKGAQDLRCMLRGP